MKKISHILGILLIVGMSSSVFGQKSFEKAGEFSQAGDKRVSSMYFDDYEDGLIIVTERGGSLRLSFGSTSPSMQVSTSVSTEHMIPNTTDHAVLWARPYKDDVLLAVYYKYGQGYTSPTRFVRMKRTGGVVFDKTFLPKTNYGDTLWRSCSMPFESFIEGNHLHIVGQYMDDPGLNFGFYTGTINLENYASEVFVNAYIKDGYGASAASLPDTSWLVAFEREIRDPDFNFVTKRVFTLTCYKKGVTLWTDSTERSGNAELGWYVASDENFAHVLLFDRDAQIEKTIYFKCDKTGVKKTVEKTVKALVESRAYKPMLVPFEDQLILCAPDKYNYGSLIVSFNSETLDTLWTESFPNEHLESFRVNTNGSYLCIFGSYDHASEIGTSHFVTFNTRPHVPEPKVKLSGDSILLHWSPPLTGGYPIIGYTVAWMKEGDKSYQLREVTDTSYLFVTNLSSGDSAKWHFTVSASNKLGRGNSSAIVTVDYRKPPKPNSVSTINPSSFLFYPNPSKGKFFIESDYSGTIEFFSISGKRISSHVIDHGTIEVTLNVDSGIYMYIITTSDGYSAGKIVIIE